MSFESTSHILSSLSDEEESYISLPLGKRLAFNESTTVTKKVSKKTERHRSVTHSMSESEDSDEPDWKDSISEATICSTKLNHRTENLLADSKEDKSETKNVDDYLYSSCANGLSKQECKTENQILALDVNLKDSVPQKLQEKKIITRAKNVAKSEKAEERLRERERKQKEKMLAKSLKDMEKELKLSTKPQECLKSMTVTIDDHFKILSDHEIILNILLDSGISYVVESNVIPYSITWFRKIIDVKMENDQVVKLEQDKLEDNMLIYFLCADFAEKVYFQTQKKKSKPAEQTLLEYATEIQDIYPQMKITYITVGIESFLKNSKIASKQDSTNTKLKNIGNVTKKDIDEVAIELNINHSINYHSVENMTEFSNFVAKFTKAIAEAPIKLEKKQHQEAFSWYAQADSSCPVKIEKDGKGCIALWQQQIQQFNNIGKDVAEAISVQYPSPLSLVEAYRRCQSTKDGEKLLQDIVVRRSYGPLGTTRKIGPELSFKMYRFFTSQNPNEFLQR